MLDIEGLAYEFIDTKTLCHRVRARRAADRYHLRTAPGAAILIEELRAVHAVAEIEIEEDHVGLSDLDLAKREIAAGRRRDLIAVVAEGVLQDANGGVVVFDDEDPFGHPRHFSGDRISEPAPFRGNSPIAA
jgi:hypothetical protein